MGTAGTPLAVAVDESADGTLDHICVAWDREEPVGNLLVHALGISILA